MHLAYTQVKHGMSLCWVCYEKAQHRYLHAYRVRLAFAVFKHEAVREMRLSGAERFDGDINLVGTIRRYRGS